MSSIVSVADAALRTLPDLDLRHQRSRKPSRCQRALLFGFTRRTASRLRRTMLDRNTSKPIAYGRKRGCLTLGDATISGYRSIMFSATSSCGERKASPTGPALIGSGRSDSASFFIRPGRDLADCGSDSGLPDEEKHDRDLAYFWYNQQALLFTNSSIILKRRRRVARTGELQNLLPGTRSRRVSGGEHAFGGGREAKA